MAKSTEKKPVIIKKYTNRRLYNTEISNYVTLNDLCEMVKRNVDFVVRDARTGEDLTHLVLTQIIFEQELKGYNLLPINFLRQIIQFYDDNLRIVLPQYLETSMGYFSQNQERMRNYVNNAWQGFEGLSPMHVFEEMRKQNQAYFDAMWQFFGGAGQPHAGETKKTDKSKE